MHCQNHEADGIFKCCENENGCDKTVNRLCSCAGKLALPLIISIAVSIVYTIISFPFLIILKRKNVKYNWIGYILIVRILALVCYFIFKENPGKLIVIAGLTQVGMSLFIISPIVGTILTFIRKCVCSNYDAD